MDPPNLKPLPPSTRPAFAVLPCRTSLFSPSHNCNHNTNGPPPPPPLMASDFATCHQQQPPPSPAAPLLPFAGPPTPLARKASSTSSITSGNSPSGGPATTAPPLSHLRISTEMLPINPSFSRNSFSISRSDMGDTHYSTTFVPSRPTRVQVPEDHLELDSTLLSWSSTDLWTAGPHEDGFGLSASDSDVIAPPTITPVPEKRNRKVTFDFKSTEELVPKGGGSPKSPQDGEEGGAEPRLTAVHFAPFSSVVFAATGSHTLDTQRIFPSSSSSWSADLFPTTLACLQARLSLFIILLTEHTAAPFHPIDALVALGWSVQKLHLAPPSATFSSLTEHVFYVVTPPVGAVDWELTGLAPTSEVKFVIDLDFMGLFQVARPTPAFTEFQAQVGSTFVGTPMELRESVRILAAKGAKSLAAQSLPLAPWRNAGFLEACYTRALALSRHLPETEIMVQTSAQNRRLVDWVMWCHKDGEASLLLKLLDVQSCSHVPLAGANPLGKKSSPVSSSALPMMFEKEEKSQDLTSSSQRSVDDEKLVERPSALSVLLRSHIVPVKGIHS